MSQFASLFQSLLTSSTFSVRFTRAALLAGAVLQNSDPAHHVNWSAVGLAALGGFLGAGEPNAPKG